LIDQQFFPVLEKMAHCGTYAHQYHADPDMCMSSCTHESRIKRIPVKEPTWRSLHDLKEAGQSFDELIAVMIQRERDYRDWKMITEIDTNGEFVAFDPERDHAG
jgi:predicted CopG family antitoxin